MKSEELFTMSSKINLLWFQIVSRFPSEVWTNYHQLSGKELTISRLITIKTKQHDNAGRQEERMEPQLEPSSSAHSSQGAGECGWRTNENVAA